MPGSGWVTCSQPRILMCRCVGSLDQGGRDGGSPGSVWSAWRQPQISVVKCQVVRGRKTRSLGVSTKVKVKNLAWTKYMRASCMIITTYSLLSQA